MRTVAVILALLSVLSLLPTSLAVDECANPGAASFCVPIDASRPSTPSGVPTPPPTPYWGRYYLWIGAGHCVPSPTGTDCRGVPAPAPGVYPPTGGNPVGAGLFGVLYQESNGVSGLQRFKYGTPPPDHMVLV